VHDRDRRRISPVFSGSISVTNGRTIGRLGTAHRHRFPGRLSAIYLEYNGGYFVEPEITPVGEGCPQDALKFMSGIGASRDTAELGESSTIDLFEGNHPPKIVPIGYTTMGGLIILDTAPGEGRGEVYYKQAFGEVYWLAESIEQFFKLLREPLVYPE
jgi:SMI1/KNR4 family protein SUKH-1